MSIGNTFEADLLKLIFQAVAIANLADNAAASPLTELHMSLHTADPGEAGTQLTSECAYGGYARKNVARTTGGFAISGSTINPVANIDFATASSGTETAGWAGVGTAASGAGKLLFSGAISPTISISNGVTPRLTTTTAITLD
jgi:hypothetical protein